MLGLSIQRLLVHLDYEQSQCPVGLVLESAAHDPPELLPVYCVIRLLYVSKGSVLPPLLSHAEVDLGHQPANMVRGGGALLEAGLVDPCVQ